MARTNDVLDDLAKWYAVPGDAAAIADRAPSPRWFATADITAAVRRGLVQIAEAFLAWHDQARERRAPMELSDQMLRDVGISRTDAHREGARPFWR
jgi:uncharacterized protein YjiS (DUF1127 family)